MAAVARLPGSGSATPPALQASSSCTSLVTSVLLYGSETWTLLADSEKRIQAFKTKCLSKLLRILYFEHKNNNFVWSKITFFVGPLESPLATIKRRKLSRSGHVTCHKSLSKTILRGTLEGGRCCGRQRKCRMDTIKEWTSLPMPELLTKASCRKDWQRISAESSIMSPQQPNQSRDWIELSQVWWPWPCFKVTLLTGVSES